MDAPRDGGSHEYSAAARGACPAARTGDEVRWRTESGAYPGCSVPPAHLTVQPQICTAPRNSCRFRNPLL